MDNPELPDSDAENLFDSVMKEFKFRVKVVPPEPIKVKHTSPPKRELIKPQLPKSKPTGLAEYSTYCKNSENMETNGHQSRTLPSRKQVSNQDNGLIGASQVPPTKPKRRNKPSQVDETTIQKPQDTSELSRLRMNSDLKEFMDSAFSSNTKSNESFFFDDDRSLDPSHSTPEHILDYDNNDTLTRENLAAISRQSQHSLDDAVEGNHKGFKPILQNDDNNIDHEDSPHFLDADDQSFGGGSDLQLDTMSMYSAMSDEEAQSNGWPTADDRHSQRGTEDNLSLSSFTSADIALDGKRSNGKRINARERAKILKKQAAAKKEKMGALFDAAASNATDKFKRLRRPSMKLPGGRHRKAFGNNPYKSPRTPPLTPNSAPIFPRSSLVTSSARSTCLKQNLDRVDSNNSQHRFSNDKHNEAVVNISAPITNHVTSDDEDEADRPQPPTREASLTSLHGHINALKNDHQVTIKSGYLKKQSNKKIKMWSEKWFVLKGEYLYYYKDVDGKYLGSIFLLGGKVTSLPIRSNESHKYLFEISPGSDRMRDHNSESHVLSASSAADMDEWIKAVRRVILSPFGGGIFGQSLAETMRYDDRHDTSARSQPSGQGTPRQVPIIVEKCVEFIRDNNGLTEEGLFRLPGETNEVKELQDAFDMGERPVFPKTTDVHTVASLLKGYLRELPEPVVPFESYDQLISAAKLSKNEDFCQQNTIADAELAAKKEEAKKIMKDQLDRIPQENFHLLGYLCHFLDEVQQYSSQNKMDISNLAMVFGPNIMRAKSGDALSMMADTNNVQHIIFQFISNHLFFFPQVETSSRLDLRFNPDVAKDESIANKRKNSDAETPSFRNATDDSGTGSMVPTPESTHKRAPPIPVMPPPIRNKPKPLRRKQSGSVEVNESILSPRDGEVADTVLPLTHTGAGNTASPDSDLSKPFANVSSYRYPVHPGPKRPKPTRYLSQNATDEESNTESVPHDEYAASTHSSLRGDFQNNSESSNIRNHPRSSSYPVTKYATTGRPNAFSGTQQGGSRRSLESESDGLSTTSAIPAVPMRNHRKLRKDDRDKLSESQRRSNSVDFPDDSIHVIPERLSTMTSTTTTSVGSRPLSYKDLEEQVRMLQNELQNQRLEHEKRSRMLEEHYVMKMKSPASSLPTSTESSMFCPPPSSVATGSHPSSSSQDRPLIPSKPNFLPRSSLGEDSTLDSKELNPLDGAPTRVRTFSTDSQPDLRYKEEVKRHAITKMKLRNAERGLRQAEERNRELQKEMENFFNAFGGVNDADYA